MGKGKTRHFFWQLSLGPEYKALQKAAEEGDEEGIKANSDSLTAEINAFAEETLGNIFTSATGKPIGIVRSKHPLDYLARLSVQKYMGSVQRQVTEFVAAIHQQAQGYLPVWYQSVRALSRI